MRKMRELTSKTGIYSMRSAAVVMVCCLASFFVVRMNSTTDEVKPVSDVRLREISGTVQKGETLFDIFNKYHIALSELFKIKEASTNIYSLKEVRPGRSYKVLMNKINQVDEFSYRIDDDLS